MNEKNWHILLLSSWFPTPTRPFLGNFIKRQALLLAERHEVTVIHTIADSSVTSFSINKKNEGNYTELSVRYNPGGNKASRWVREKRAFSETLRQIQRPDLVHGHILFGKAWQFRIAKRFFKCPLIVTDQGSYYHKPPEGIRGFVQHLFLRKFARDVDTFIAVSEFLIPDIRPYFPDTPVAVIPNHVDTHLFSLKEPPNGKKFRFLHISTLDERFKDPENLFNGIALLSKKRSDFSLTVVCDEPVEKWKRYCQTKGIDHLVHFDGPMNWEQIADTYRRHDAFILTSVYETFSIVIAESLCSGMPVVSTPVGIAASLPPDCAIHFQAGNAKDLAEKLESMIDHYGRFDPEKIRAYGSRFSGNEVLAALEKTYEQLLEPA